MQNQPIRERLSEVEQCILNAAQLCDMSNDVPERVRDCVSQLEKQKEQALTAAEDADDESVVKRCLSDMEKTGDRALQAFGQAGYVDVALQNAVKQARKAIASVKRQLH